ncbi:MAG: nuclear transport factor 2 family protein [Thermoanaerobaculia bacterium]|nr:nuclear transport factor 2 family protein [Thermoanaerobaculia bacterium]
MRPLQLAFLVLVLAVPTQPSFGQSTKELALDFVAAFEAVRQPDVEARDFENYFAFMADDVVDHHVAYGVMVSGKEKPRENLKRKLPNNISFDIEIEDMIVGTSTAVVVLNEDSEYKKDGKYKHFVGRTILVLEFNEERLIQEMRRYLD